MPIGTTVMVFGYGQLRRHLDHPDRPGPTGRISQLHGGPDGAAFDARIYAVIHGRLFPGEPVPNDTVIIYTSGLIIAVTQTGLTYISSGCDSTGMQWLEGRIARMGSQPSLLKALK